MAFVRSVAAVVAGYLVFALSALLLFNFAGVEPHATAGMPIMVFTVVYGMVFATLGGLLSARMAPRRAELHAAILAVLVALGAAGSLIASSSTGSTWTQWATIIFMAPCAALAPRITRWRRPDGRPESCDTIQTLIPYGWAPSCFLTRDHQGVRSMKDISIAIVFAIAGWMLKTWLGHREKMRELSMAKQGLGASEQRLARVEHAVESIAIEVERIGEGQRYVTSMLDGRARPVLEQLPRAVPRTDTPH